MTRQIHLTILSAMERRMDRRTFIKTAPLFLGALVVAHVAGKGDIDEQGTQRDAVDPQLNRNRTNFLFFVQGETHEPPLIERGIIGSHTLISIDSQRYVFDRISWTHDLRVPEVERYLQQNSKDDGRAKKIDEAYRYGGFPLMRQAVEAATGLAVHSQVAADDSLVVDVVDKVASKIQIENPKSFWAYKIYFQGQSFPEKYFAQGKQSLDGVAALQYIKAVPKDIENGIYSPNLGFEVPFNHRMDFQTNPYAEDLIKGYWLPLRLRILKLLTN